MRIIALGNLSGAVGDRAKGEEFSVDAKTGNDLIARGLARQAEAPPGAEKPAKAKE
ncbi:hypothetical protein [Pseudomonas sp. Z4-20]|uniref:hypothetical protein n=1 Tax=Pseudomonas sp. Z4-20 TaxID=2817414 RepID=UPI003DA9C50C